MLRANRGGLNINYIVFIYIISLFEIKFVYSTNSTLERKWSFMSCFDCDTDKHFQIEPK